MISEAAVISKPSSRMTPFAPSIQQSHDDVAQRAVVHVDHAPPDHLPRIHLGLPAMMQMVVDEGGAAGCAPLSRRVDRR